ncbi:MAG: helix-turn-helix domain-containing protein [Clostridia bacterium]|jgi:repressor LexA|nr:helix-turn-helix domain-containing protein [Clostridia bacterium]
MSIGKIIKQERIKQGFSQEDLAKAIGSTKQAIYKYETGIVTNIPTEKIEKIALFLGVSPTYLLGWQSEESSLSGFYPINTKRLPLLGNVACGEPIFADESKETYVSAESGIDADFCLIAKGDSMINARIFDGDLLFVKKTDIVDNGNIAVILIEDEATVKRFYYDREENTVTLIPENPLYRPMRYSGTELDRIRVLGRVVAGQYNI